MQRSFTYTLLITWLFAFGACKTHYIQTDAKGDNVVVSDSIIQLDSQLVQIYLPYKKLLEKDMSRVLAVNEKEMVKRKPESALTNFLADLLLDEGQKVLQQSGKDFQADISYFNYGGIRTYLPEGEITVGKIYELMPFENELVFLKLNGNQIREFLNTVASKGGESVGGVRFSISEEKAKDIIIGSKPFENEKYYWVATNDYVAEGGDDLDVFTQNNNYFKSGKLIRNVIISHLENISKKGNTIAAETDGRIRYE
jgi:2',3'-cyclic-nucleotide 2'-phosphodiesterase (5'-nucleotidase family)